MALELTYDAYLAHHLETANSALALASVPMDRLTYAQKQAYARTLVQKDEACLAPGFKAALLAAEQDCQRLEAPIKVYETCRSNELARIYHELGVSKATTGLRTWHFYSLATDIIHPVHGWDWWTDGGENGKEWRNTVVQIMKSHNMKWGGDWVSFKDRPHFQWAACKPSPSDRAIFLLQTKGLPAVWREVGAAA